MTGLTAAARATLTAHQPQEAQDREGNILYLDCMADGCGYQVDVEWPTRSLSQPEHRWANDLTAAEAAARRTFAAHQISAIEETGTAPQQAPDLTHTMLTHLPVELHAGGGELVLIACEEAGCSFTVTPTHKRGAHFVEVEHVAREAFQWHVLQAAGRSSTAGDNPVDKVGVRPSRERMAPARPRPKGGIWP